MSNPSTDRMTSTERLKLAGEMVKMAVPAEAFRLARPLIRSLRSKGFNIERIQPLSSEALLKPWHSSLPKEPMGSNMDLSGKKIQIAKGQLRSPQLPGGTNYSLSTLGHEAGHALHDVQYGQYSAGQLGARPNNPIRAMATPIRELQANNTALQYMQQMNASPEAVEWYKQTRLPSYKSHLQSARNELISNYPPSNPYYHQVRPLWERIKSFLGYTPSLSARTDLPEVFQKLGGVFRSSYLFK